MSFSSEFVKHAPHQLVSGGNDGQLALWSTKDTVESTAADDDAVIGSLGRWSIEPFTKINWLTTTDAFGGSYDIFVSGITTQAKDDGVVAGYTLI